MKLVASEERVYIGKRRAVIYLSPRGVRYIRRNGEYERFVDNNSVPSTSTKRKYIKKYNVAA